MNNKKKELNTNLSPIQEAKVIISSIPDRLRIVENLCKLEINGTGKIFEKECVSQGKKQQLKKICILGQ